MTLSKVRVEDLCRKESVDSEPADEESKPRRLLTELDVGDLIKRECVNHPKLRMVHVLQLGTK